jgi:hypothetical protein
MKSVFDRIGEALESQNDKYHLLTTISVVLLVLTFMGASLWVLITSAA